MGYKMSRFRELSKGMNSGLLPTGRPAYGVPPCSPLRGSNHLCNHPLCLIQLIFSFAVINTKASWTINTSSSCTDPFIIFSASFVVNRICSVMQHNFDIAVEDFSFSSHLSPYLERYGFFCWPVVFEIWRGFPR